MITVEAIASGSKGNCYLVSDGKTDILIDAGVSISEIRTALCFRLNAISGCLISHNHQDHCKAVRDLITQGVDIYASGGTLDELGITNYRAHPVFMKEFYIGSWKIKPFDIQHDASEPLGFYMKSMETGESLLYFTDTFYLKYKFPEITYIMAECNYNKATMEENIGNGTLHSELAARIVKSHMSLENLLDMLRASDLSKLRRVYLLHMSNDNCNEAQAKEAVQKLTGVEVTVC
ncbi:MAG: MBL fold metallo-hydrolase [Candidatus Paceibacterota bacterium]|jgi:phosphoribosyl 1,2-cyclic phosphodiesterase